MINCLTDLGIRKIKEALKSGKINPTDLAKMTSEERRAFFEKFLSKEEAIAVNLLFEKKLLLKKQERAMVSWAKEITGISKEAKEELAAKIRETYAEKKRRVFNPKEDEVFLNELASDVYAKRFKTDVTLEEAQIITEMSQEMNENKEKLGDVSKWKTEDFKLTGSKKDALKFGSSLVALNNYVGDLKAKAVKRGFLNPKEVGWWSATLRAGEVSADFIASNARALVASFDNSLWGRQGFKVFWTHPTVWAKDFVKSFSDIYKTIKGGNTAGDLILDAVKADVYSRENYMKGRYEKGKKLDIGTGEEEFPTSAPAKIPVLGRAFKAAEIAYEAGAMRMRADLADLIYKIAENGGVDMTDKEEVGAINEQINGLTGRGPNFLGLTEGKAGSFINKAFFSIKFFSSNLNVLTGWATNKTSFTKKQAALNLLKMVSGTAIILMIAKALDPDSVEFDPRSANFGKIKIKNTRLDITGGIAPIITLIARIGSQSTKSSVTGLEMRLNEAYGSPDAMSLFWNFTENKFSPMFSTIKEIVNQKTFEGKDPTILNTLKNMTIPMVISGAWDANKIDGLGMAILGFIADGLGISANTYAYEENWQDKNTKELQTFRKRVGEDNLKIANKEYNRLVNEKIDELNKDPKYLKMTEEDKVKELAKQKREIKDKILNRRY